MATAYSCNSSHPSSTARDLRGINSCSPVMSGAEPEGTSSLGDHHSLNTPLTPPLSVSPVSVSTSPCRPHSISPVSATTYFEKENTIGYRSGSTSPSAPTCDSTSAVEQLMDSNGIPKLPLQMLSVSFLLTLLVLSKHSSNRYPSFFPLFPELQM